MVTMWMDVEGDDVASDTIGLSATNGEFVGDTDGDVVGCGVEGVGLTDDYLYLGCSMEIQWDSLSET